MESCSFLLGRYVFTVSPRVVEIAGSGEDMKTQDAFDALVFRAQVDAMNGYCSHTVERCVREGKPIPEQYLPGRFLMRTSPEIQEALKDLTPEMTQQRLY